MMIHPGAIIIFIVAVLVLFAGGGWRTVSDADRDERMKLDLKALNRDSFELERKVFELDLRVKALEAKQ